MLAIGIILHDSIIGGRLLRYISILLLLLLLAFPVKLRAQENQGAVVLSDSLINFGEVFTGTQHSQSIFIRNDSQSDFTLAGVEMENKEFSIEWESDQVLSNDSVKVTIHFYSEHNIDYHDFLRISIDDYTRPLIGRVTAQVIHPDNYYDNTKNKWDEELKQALHEISANHVSLGYSPARDHMYGSIDNVDGYVECVYTGRKAFFNDRPGATQNQFNCEHTWPQSFFSENEPMRSDLYHLYPTDEEANSKRANYDFGPVNSATWMNGGSMLGTNSYNQTVFEPRDVHKGNVARSHFYFIIRYAGNYLQYQNPELMEAILRDWHIEDEVDDSEMRRNEAIYALQNNRNPFIDHPAFVDRIDSFFSPGNRAYQPEIAVAPNSFDIGQLDYDTNITLKLAILNTGQDTLFIGQIQSTNEKFSVLNSLTFLEQESYAYVWIKYVSPTFDTIDSTRVVILSNDEDEGRLEIPIIINVHSAVSIENQNSLVPKIQLFQNYPNPFNNQTIIAYQLYTPGHLPVDAELNIFNTLGQRVETIRLPAQSTGLHRFRWNAENLPSGIYYFSLRIGAFMETRKMIRLN